MEGCASITTMSSSLAKGGGGRAFRRSFLGRPLSSFFCSLLGVSYLEESLAFLLSMAVPRKGKGLIEEELNEDSSNDDAPSFLETPSKLQKKEDKGLPKKDLPKALPPPPSAREDDIVVIDAHPSMATVPTQTKKSTRPQPAPHSKKSKEKEFVPIASIMKRAKEMSLQPHPTCAERETEGVEHASHGASGRQLAA
uniref:Uncharacterized protein n=1 Tax=Cannabis sativa TaxID=3483 RepID=A0A803PD04_CANSA